MEQLTLQNVAWIGLLTLIAVTASITWQCRADVARLFHRYAVVNTSDDDHTSSADGRREPFPNESSHGSYAGNRLMERLGTEAGNTVPFSVPALVKALTELSDDELLTVLAALPGDADGYRFADSRLAKFIGGRVEDRLAQVRDARGKDTPLPPGRQVEIHHNGQRQAVVMD